MASRFFLTIIIFITLALTRCERKNRIIIPEQHERFVEVYVALQKLGERHLPPAAVPIDSSRAIIREYGFSREEYDQAYAYFNEKPERWQAFYKEVLERIKKSNATSARQ
jgi:hypothetical protein